VSDGSVVIDLSGTPLVDLARARKNSNFIENAKSGRVQKGVLERRDGGSEAKDLSRILDCTKFRERSEYSSVERTALNKNVQQTSHCDRPTVLVTCPDGH